MSGYFSFGGTVCLYQGGCMRVLLVEDDQAIEEFLQRVLVEAGYQVDAVANAEDGMELALEGIHDIFIVDLNLPGMDGLEFISLCRGQGVSAPVLILSARRSIDERVRGLERGGDDYLTKPFAVAELLARLHALLRRTTPAQGDTVHLQVADLEMDLVRREVRRDDQLLHLTPQEFSMLEYFCRNARRVLTRSMILDHVWRMRFDPSCNVVDVHVHRLRRKLECNGKLPLIHTIRGVGYVLKDPRAGD
jgi:DNA-binding response OmpR family regulator